MTDSRATPPRVLHILNELRLSGAEVMLACGSEYLYAGSSAIISTGDSVGEFSQTLKGRGYEIIHLPFRKNIRFFNNIYEIIKIKNFDVVHIHTERAAFWYELAAKFARKPTIRTVHNEFLFEGLLKFRRTFTRKLSKFLGTRFIACSDRVKRNELSRFANKSERFNNWFNLESIPFQDCSVRCRIRHELGFEAVDFVSISVANEAPAKNLYRLFEAINLVGVSIKHIHVGQVSDDLRDFVDGLSNKNVVLLGSRVEVGELLNAADCFLNVSTYEGGQLVLLEAAASGVVCITTDVGLAESLKGIPGAYFTDPDVDAIVSTINGVKRVSSSVRLAEGGNLSEFVRQNFSPMVGAQRYARLYEDLI